MHNHKKHLYIYRDDGADLFFVNCLYQELSKTFKGTPVAIRFISAKQIIDNPDWTKKALALVMPGGRDEPYHQKLTGEGNRIIKDYVQNGGIYLGFCAGAYYACHELKYKETVTSRELEFFPGTAQGPIADLKGVKADNFPAEAASIAFANSQSAEIYYQDGPAFVNNSSAKVKVLASYLMQDQSKKDALIICDVGKGKAVLCGFHPEVSGKNFMQGFKKFYPHRSIPIEFVKTLQANERLRKTIWQKIIDSAGLKSNLNIRAKNRELYSKKVLRNY